MKKRNDVQDAIRIRALCTIFVKLANQDMERRMKRGQLDLSFSAFFPLRLLQLESLTVQELSRKLILAPATLIPIIDELETKGLITRETSPADRRKKLLRTTKKGTQLMRQVVKLNMDSQIMRAVNHLDDLRKRQVIESLEMLLKDITGSDEIAQTIEKNARQAGSLRLHTNYNDKSVRGR